MGACALLPRVIGQGRASAIALFSRSMSGDEGERWGFFNRLVRARIAPARRARLGRRSGVRADLCPWHDQKDAAAGVGTMGVDEAIEAERRPRQSAWPPMIFIAPITPFVEKQKPEFKGD